MFGFALAFFIWRKKRLGQTMVCPLNSDCNAVIYSKHSTFFGIPVEVMGLVYYGIIAISYLFFLVTSYNASSLIVFLVLVASTAAVLFSVYLTIIQIFGLKQWCVWCLTSAALCGIIFTLAIIGSGFGFIPLLEAYYQTFLLFHVFGVALGLGGALIADVLFFKFLEDFKISTWEVGVMHTVSQVIWFALGMLIITGLCFYLVNPVELNQSPKFLVKMIVVAVITVNGALLNLVVAPNLTKISFDGNSSDAKRYRYMRRLAFALGAVSMTSWLSAFLLGAMRSIRLTFFPLLLLYVGALAAAIVLSQIMDRLFLARSQKR